MRNPFRRRRKHRVGQSHQDVDSTRGGLFCLFDIKASLREGFSQKPLGSPRPPLYVASYCGTQNIIKYIRRTSRWLALIERPPVANPMAKQCPPDDFHGIKEPAWLELMRCTLPQTIMEAEQTPLCRGFHGLPPDAVLHFHVMHHSVLQNNSCLGSQAWSNIIR